MQLTSSGALQRRSGLALALGLLFLLVSTSTLSATEPAKPAGRTLAYDLMLSNGAEVQVRAVVTASTQEVAFQGIVRLLQTNQTCSFDEKEDSTWKRIALDVACGKSRLAVRYEMPSVSADSAGSAQVPRMVKLLVGGRLYAWTVVGEVPQDTNAAARGTGAVRALPREFQSALGDVAKALVSEEFSTEAAALPAGFHLLRALLDSDDLKAEVVRIRPLTADEADGLARLAAGR